LILESIRIFPDHLTVLTFLASRRQTGGRPEAGMNEEASAGREVVQN